MKTNSTFKLSKTHKRMLATTYNSARQSAFKQIFIDADLSFEESKKRLSKSKESEDSAG